MRKGNSNGQRLDKTEKDISTIKKQLEETEKNIIDMKKQQEDTLKRNILDDLEMETYYNSGRPLYTYDDIAIRWGVKRSKVQKIAESSETRRKGKKIIGG